MAWLRHIWRWFIDADGLDAVNAQEAEWEQLIANARPNCPHIWSHVRGKDLIGYAYCPNCNALVPVALWLNNLANNMRRR